MRVGVIGIYAIEHIPTGKMYIGSSIDILDRWGQHKKDLRAGKHHSVYLQRAWNKYGIRVFTLKILEGCRRLDLLFKEQEWFNKLRPFDNKNGYNCNRIPGKPPSPVGRVLSKETKSKISTAHIGRPKSIAHRRKISNYRQNNPLSDFQRQRIAEGVRMPEVRKKISETIKKQYANGKQSPFRRPEVRIKAVITRRKNGGYVMSPEMKNRISITLTGRKQSEETKRKKSESLRKISWLLSVNNPMKRPEVVERWKKSRMLKHNYGSTIPSATLEVLS